MDEKKPADARPEETPSRSAPRRFSARVIEYGVEPRNCGLMERPDASASLVGACGDTMEIFLRVRQGVVEDVRYITDGCMTSHAAASAATVMAKGKFLNECLKITRQAILDHLGGLPPDSEHCADLAATALHRAVRNFYVDAKMSFAFYGPPRDAPPPKKRPHAADDGGKNGG